MRKGLVAILAVAIIGSLGIYGKNRAKSAQTEPTAPPTSSAVASDSTSNTSASSRSQSSGFKDGTYTGSTSQIAYGPVQVAVVINGGKITDVNFLQMPGDLGHTQEVTAQSEPLLKQQTLSNQNAHVDFVSGATDTSFGYQQSLQAALDQAS